MTFLNWIQDNGFTLLQSLGIIGGLFFTGLSLRVDAKVRRVANGFELTKQHREIWSQLYSKPQLRRVLNANEDLERAPVTPEEELFVNFLILHLANAHRAMKSGVFVLPDEIREDLKGFFALPIPRLVWETTKKYRNRDFIAFVEAHRRQ